METVSNVINFDIQKQRHNEKLRRSLGQVALNALNDPNTTEIILNPDGCLWVETLTNGMSLTGEKLNAYQAENLISAVASSCGTICNAQNPMLECELPLDGSRFEALLPPVSPAPCFVIRKRASILYTLDSYVKHGICKPWHIDLIKHAIKNKQNILIAGGTGSGKTTLVNAIISEMVELSSTDERFILLEDTCELQCSAKNTLQLHTTDSIDLLRLTRATMRLRPDRIIVGEIRGAEANSLLKVWNTGHPGGLTTIHADSAKKALNRLEMLIQEANVIPQPRIIADTISYVLAIQRCGKSRTLSEAVMVRGFNEQLSNYDLFTLDEHNIGTIL